MSRRAGLIVFLLGAVVLALCAGLIAWRLLRPKSADLKPSAAAAAPTTSTLTSERPVSPLALSTIIDLPGDPVLAPRGSTASPRETRISLPARLGPNAPRIEGATYYVGATLLSADGGYMGKFPESGADADALARQLEINAQTLAQGEDSGGAGEATDDDGGASTPSNALEVLRSSANSSRVEIAVGARPQLKQVTLRPLMAARISDLLIKEGFSEESSHAAEDATKERLNVQSLLPRSVALVVGSQDPSGAYRVAQLALYDGAEYLGAVALADSGVYEPGARPTAPPDLLDDGPVLDAQGRFTLADGVYSAGLRNAIPESVIREALQMLGRIADVKASLSADETMRVLYSKDFRGKSKIAGRVVYIGLGGSAGAFDCYAFEASDGAFRCFDPKTGTAPSASGDAGAVGSADALAPIKGAVVTSLFGMRLHPILHILRLHGGIDFGAQVGSPVRAAADGRIEIAGPVAGFGNHIRIQHKGFETSYSHLSEIPPEMKPGVEVRQGDTIALSGNTGLSTGPHLHFEYYLNGAPVDPLPHLSAEAQASAPGGALHAAVAGAAAPTPLPPHAREAELAAFPAAKSLVDAALAAAAK